MPYSTVSVWMTALGEPPFALFDHKIATCLLFVVDGARILGLVLSRSLRYSQVAAFGQDIAANHIVFVARLQRTATRWIQCKMRRRFRLSLTFSNTPFVYHLGLQASLLRKHSMSADLVRKTSSRGSSCLVNSNLSLAAETNDLSKPSNKKKKIQSCLTYSRPELGAHLDVVDLQRIKTVVVRIYFANDERVIWPLRVEVVLEAVEDFRLVLVPIGVQRLEIDSRQPVGHSPPPTPLTIATCHFSCKTRSRT